MKNSDIVFSKLTPGKIQNQSKEYNFIQCIFSKVRHFSFGINSFLGNKTFNKTTQIIVQTPICSDNVT